MQKFQKGKKGEEKKVAWRMGEESPAGSYTTEVLDILMGSGLYFELPLQERQMLLKHVMEAYHQRQSSREVN